VTTSYPGDAVNFGGAYPEKTDRYQRAREFVEVCKGLWDSWAHDAFPQDKTTGQFLDSRRCTHSTTKARTSRCAGR
jgi:N-acetyl-S-(2-succino)cysteine monooxygenase